MVGGGGKRDERRRGGRDGGREESFYFWQRMKDGPDRRVVPLPDPDRRLDRPPARENARLITWLHSFFQIRT